MRSSRLQQTHLRLWNGDSLRSSVKEAPVKKLTKVTNSAIDFRSLKLGFLNLDIWVFRLTTFSLMGHLKVLIFGQVLYPLCFVARFDFVVSVEECYSEL